ncbi:MAG: glucuronate isomerase [Actinomycetota bacterium]
MAHGFLNDDFLLSGETARVLFHGVAEHAPIVDLHNHLSPADIADDRVYETLTDLWLEDDHYKWRAMRLAGLDERLVTGDADPWERFAAWAATLPRLIRNPLYVWSHLELRRVFGIDLPLDPSTAREIWDETNRQLPKWSTQALLSHFDVRVVATTDDPGDDLAAHRQAAGNRAAMIPTFRPDGAHRLLDDPPAWNTWIDRLETAAETKVDDLASLLDALTRSYARFAAIGGRASDHGLACLPDVPRDSSLADAAIRRARAGGAATTAERDAVMLEVVALTARLAFADESVLQLHLGPIRDVSPRLLAQVGHDAGGDAVGDARQAPGLVRFLGRLEQDGTLPRTILYNVNPADNAMFATIAGAFSRPGVESLVQWGPPWWFNDHEQGMRRQLDDLSQIGQLAGFVGMLTDSRSILSMTRHELFRRVLCDAIGRDVDEGRIPADIDWCSAVVRDICVDNAVRYFSLPVPWPG